MNKQIHQYRSIIFDCDGVILDSNQIKTKAFFESTKHFGTKQAQELVDYHLLNGGISRYAKFEYFIIEILKIPFDNSLHNKLLNLFAAEVKQRLLLCKVAKDLDILKKNTERANWLVVSGGDQNEIRDTFTERSLDGYFDGGIFGSPDTKDIILARELENQNIKRPALFLGDSKYDYEAAKKANFDFIFLSAWTEVNDYKNWCKELSINIQYNLSTLSNKRFD